MNWSLLASSYGAVFGNVQVLLMTFLGALGGVLLGAIPGMTATMGVALLIPLLLRHGSDSVHRPAAGHLLRRHVRRLDFRHPDSRAGHPAAAATLLDGYPMCQKGQAGKALSVAMFASFVGGVIGALIMTFLSPIIADMAELRPRRNVHAGGLRPLRDRRHLRQVHRQGSCERLLRHAAVHRRPRPDQRHPALYHL